MITREEEVSWAYLLDPCFQFENTAGKPLTGGYIEVYLHGTRDRYYCASDFNGTLHPFQIKLDSIGSNIVLADPSNSYDVYVYNRYGNLVMSRYNVSTGHTGSGAYDRYDELENLIVSAVTALQGEIDDIDEALDGKKDKQEAISLTFTNTQTVSSIVQNENGELEITYQEIALPEQVPNIDIVSLASTISVSSVYDPETNIKTFNIDISDIGALEYGRYTAEPFNIHAMLVKNKGNIAIEDGMLKLRKGNSYHVTVRGDYTSSDLDNTVQVIEYVEQVSNSRIKIDVDNTVAEPQHFELSYDIFKLGHDTDYQVGFSQGTGVIGNLVLEIHSLSNVSVVNGGGGEQVQADWTEEDPEEPSYIQHKPDIKDLVEGTNIRFREEEDAIYIDAVVTAIPTVTGFATHEEVYESSVTAVQLATAQIPDSEEVQFEEINLDDYALASAIPSVTGFATHSEVYNATVTAIDFVTAIIPEEQVQSDWAVTAVDDPAYIKHKPEILETLPIKGGDNIGIEIDNDEVVISVTGEMGKTYTAGDYISIDDNDVISVTGVAAATAIPDTEEVQFEEIDLSDYALASAIPSVTSLADRSEVYNATVTAIDFVTAIIPEAQVQSDWTEEDDTDPAYILNKPTEKFLLEGDNIRIRETNEGVYIDALVTAIPSVTGFATDDEVYNATVTAVQLATAQIPDVSDMATDDEIYNATVTAVQLATGQIPDVSEFVTEDQVTALLPDTEDVQFEEINLGDYALASAIPDVTDLASKAEVYNSVVTGVQLATAQIPDVSDMATQTWVGEQGFITSIPSSYATDTEVYNATVTAVNAATAVIPDISGMPTDAEVYNATVTGVQLATAQIPDSEDVTFEEVDLSDYVLVSAIPDISNLTTQTDVYNATVTAVQLATAQIPDVSSLATDTDVYNATVTAFNAATAVIPDSEDVTFEEVDLSDYALATAIPDVSNLTTQTDVYNATVTAVQLATAQIPDVSDMATQSWVGEQGYLTSIPSTYATDTEVYNATVTGLNAATGWVDSQNYLTSVPNTYATKTYVDNSVTGLQTKLTGINDIQVVASLPASPTSSTLYLIPESV